MTLGLTAVAAIATAFVATIHIASYGPAEWGPVLSNLALLAFPALFPVFGFAVVVLAFGRLPVDRLLAGLPRPVIAAGIVIVAYIAFDFILMIKLLPGQPEQQGSGYFLNNGGDLTPIDAHSYHQALMYVARLFTGHELVFFGFAAAIGYEIDRVRTGRLNLDAGPRDEALEQHPLPPPFSRLVTLQTMLTAEECVQRLRQPIPQGFFSFFGRYGVRGEVTPAGFRLELGGMQSSMVYAVGKFEGSGRTVFIRILLTFKRWTLIALALSALLIPVFWLVFNAVRFPFGWQLFLFMAVFVVGGNIAYVMGQMQSLLNQIKRATGGESISAG